MNRRTFLQYGCAGLVSAVLGSGVYSYLSMKDTRALRNEYREQLFPGLSDDAIRILYLASLAPSGHNTQPWRVRIQEPWQWVIGSRKSSWLSAVDPDNRELLLSVGTFLENLSVAAGICGYQAVYDVIGQDGFSEDLVKVFLQPNAASGASENTIRQRRTLRKGLTKTAIRESDLAALVGKYADRVFYYPRESTQGRFLSQIVLTANRIQTDRYDARAELGEWIRWTDQEAQRYGSGLTPDSMEMGGVAKWYAQHFMDKESVHTATFSKETIKLVKDQIEHCAGWLIVRSKDSTVKEIVNAGRIVESMWLKAREKQIAFHPMTQPLEETDCRGELIKTINGAGELQFIIRIGYVNEYPAPVSLRAPMEKFVVMQEEA